MDFKEDSKAENQKGYIKIYKNTKGYNWEIKALEDFSVDNYKELVAKLQQINNEMLNNFNEV